MPTQKAPPRTPHPPTSIAVTATTPVRKLPIENVLREAVPPVCYILYTINYEWEKD